MIAQNNDFYNPIILLATKLEDEIRNEGEFKENDEIIAGRVKELQRAINEINGNNPKWGSIAERFKTINLQDVDDIKKIANEVLLQCKEDMHAGKEDMQPALSCFLEYLKQSTLSINAIKRDFFEKNELYLSDAQKARKQFMPIMESVRKGVIDVLREHATQKSLFVELPVECKDEFAQFCDAFINNALAIYLKIKEKKFEHAVSFNDEIQDFIDLCMAMKNIKEEFLKPTIVIKCQDPTQNKELIDVLPHSEQKLSEFFSKADITKFDVTEPFDFSDNSYIKPVFNDLMIYFHTQEISDDLKPNDKDSSEKIFSLLQASTFLIMPDLQTTLKERLSNFVWLEFLSSEEIEELKTMANELDYPQLAPACDAYLLSKCLDVNYNLSDAISKKILHLDLDYLPPHFKEQPEIILKILDDCPNLVTINLSALNHLNDDLLNCITQKCPSLKSLDISNCDDITDEGLSSLMEHCPALESLNMTGCSKLSLEELQKKWPELTIDDGKEEPEWAV